MHLPRMSRRGFGAAALAAAAYPVLGGPVPAFAEDAQAKGGERYHAPAEWEPHSACVMAWPWDRNVGWGPLLDEVQGEVAGIARAVARHETVVMFAEPGQADRARARCGSSVTVTEYPVNDCWARDTGPVLTVNDARTRSAGLDFGFNGWGGKYPYDKDDFLPVGVCAYLDVPRQPVAMVLEGGSVITDGQGTLITTEECLLNPNRNPGLTRAQIEAALLASYGASKVVWLPYGLAGDDITNGHVDLVAAYLGPARLLLHTQPDPANPNHDRMAANKAVLDAATDACGRPFQIVEMQHQPQFRHNGLMVRTFSYTNYYETSGNVVVPTAGEPADAAALAQFAALFPGRQVVGAPARTLAWGGGGVHCVTQHVPRVR
ncbi:agmatine deiminase family protein [Streptomyces sp. WAC07061]|uniref:agmatine deiminase family protein n=1 Tax=Streptomyces sp. WAC07061 TaxID=2487410 RepID=UPI000F76A12B|nr:agmatine deiminase family protein [Streptomyces sp. WAC07061]RSS54747.1 agmatine deiminase family protein [Streptomyces sp. WAC07061]